MVEVGEIYQHKEYGIIYSITEVSQNDYCKCKLLYTNSRKEDVGMFFGNINGKLFESDVYRRIDD